MRKYIFIIILFFTTKTLIGKIIPISNIGSFVDATDELALIDHSQKAFLDRIIIILSIDGIYGYKTYYEKFQAIFDRTCKTFKVDVDFKLLFNEVVRFKNEKEQEYEILPEFLHTLKRNHFKFLGLCELDETLNYCEIIDIFSKSKISFYDEYSFHVKLEATFDKKNITFKQGILFENNLGKVNALISLLQNIPFTPSLVYWLDGDYDNLQGLEQILKMRHIQFVGYLYQNLFGSVIKKDTHSIEQEIEVALQEYTSRNRRSPIKRKVVNRKHYKKHAAMK